MGSAGEFVALTEAERMRAIKCILAEVNGQVPVDAGTGQYRTRIAIGLSIHAQKKWRCRADDHAALSHAAARAISGRLRCGGERVGQNSISRTGAEQDPFAMRSGI